MKHFLLILTLCVMLLSGNFTSQNVALAQSCCEIPGDANDDGGLTGMDAVYLVNYFWNDGPPPTCPDETDVNNDYNVSGLDVVFILNYLWHDGPAPVCPSPPGLVFDDEYATGVTYEAFLDSYLEAVQIDTDSMYAGYQGLEITIPDESWSGGAFTATMERDLSVFNAITFYAKASTAATLDVAGIGNDNTGTSLYTAEVAGLALTTTWQQFVIPIPLPEKLNAERGLFFFAEGAEGGVGYQIWMDEIVYDSLTTITNPRPVITTETIEVEVNQVVNLSNGIVTFDVDGTDMDINTMPGYFTFFSSNPSIVSVSQDGVITAENVGTANLTAQLGTVSATGSVTVNVNPPLVAPATPAAAPTVNADSVISLFSDVYTDHPVDTWSADWDNADVSDFVVDSDNMKRYTNLVYAGIEFTTTTIDASEMTHFHMDVWTPDPTASPATFKVKLVDFGNNGTYGGPDDTEYELVFDENTMSTENWVSIDVPLASFIGMGTGHIAQLIISSVDISTVYVDNIYFYNSGLPTDPLTPAPVPTLDQSLVASLYSDVYTDATTVNTWSAPWDQADVENYVIDSDNTKKYTNLVFAGIEFTSNPLDASATTHFHMDVWTADPTASPAVFKVKLVDAGDDGVIGGTDDSEHELTFDETTMNTGEWVGIDVPLTEFTGLTARAHLAQMIISGDPNTVWVDNIYFYTPPPTEPTSSAPTPSEAQADVMSVFSNAYTGTEFDVWSSEWDNADVADFAIGGDDLKKYYNLVFSIAEYTTSGTLDLSTMTHFRMDVWTPDATTSSSEFKIKLVDYGANGVWDGGGDDVEHELTFDEATMSSYGWVSFDIPLTEFTGMTTKEHFAQLILSGTYGTVFIDNIYFHK